MSEQSFVPPLLWRDHPDRDVREFYSVLNTRSTIEEGATVAETLQRLDGSASASSSLTNHLALKK
jgi:hypothetical protein